MKKPKRLGWFLGISGVGFGFAGVFFFAFSLFSGSPTYSSTITCLTTFCAATRLLNSYSKNMLGTSLLSISTTYFDMTLLLWGSSPEDFTLMNLLDA